LSREDLFTVVHDPFLSMTARYADIVLPAATYLETEDFYRSYGSYYMQYGHRAVAPFGEARSNAAVAQALAARMGLDDPVFRMSQDQMVQELFRGATGTVEHVDATSIRDAGPINIAPKGGQQFRTASGKLEFYSETMAKQGLPPMPDWQPDPQEERERRALAATAADCARLLPEPHRVLLGGIPTRARRRALLRPAS